MMILVPIQRRFRLTTSVAVLAQTNLSKFQALQKARIDLSLCLSKLTIYSSRLLRISLLIFI